ncbi:hypothetical protein ACHAW5_002436 [Stephanodiscus triporus]|uniref:Uncharacterized protein n=1 Tax=Stephanodiscus triporus TaxID=2934178 RepID=A0ABD3NYT9_9STRA
MDFSTAREILGRLGLRPGLGLGFFDIALLFTALSLLAPPLYWLYRYRKSIRKRVEEIEKIRRVRVVRNKNSASKKRRRVICMELDPAFVESNPGWKVMSLGEYLGQLEPEKRSGLNDLFLQKELELAIGDLLLKTLGRTYGAALLPILGAASVAASIGKISNRISKFLHKCILTPDDDIDDIEDESGDRRRDHDRADAAVDRMSLDVSLMEVVSLINAYQKATTPSDDTSRVVTPLEYLSRGENDAGDLAYDAGDGGFPDAFDMDDFRKHVATMEGRILERSESYDPDDRSYPPPTPIHQRLLPDLCLGRGDLKCTHTKREGVEHRLLCVLLNKLCHNYHKLSAGVEAKDCFAVTCAGERCLFPEELIAALVRCGHKVEVCPRSIVTNFGMQLCVKDEDGSFAYVPTALFLRTGIDRTADGKATYFAAPHGGMDVNISGPIVGGGARPAWLQFYVSIAGLCCFHPDEDVDAPWQAKTSLADIYPHDDALRAVRMCAIVSVTFNRIATEFHLPFGGYGILGMCNDSSTIVDFALRGRTNAYPLLSTGRYLNHIVSYFVKLMDELSERSASVSNLRPVIDDILCLIKGTSRLPSDLHISPATLIDTARRHGATYGTPVFQNTKDAKAILSEMADSARKYLE